MRVSVAWLKTALGIALAAWVIWLFLLWQPARQIELHTLNLLARSSARDWPAVEAMMAPGYRDARHEDRASAVAAGREWTSHFFALQIVPLGDLPVNVSGDEGQASGALGVFGSGTYVAQAVMDAARELREPFVFRWRKSGRWPWQWQLTGIAQTELAARYGR
jgi:hypothetical protein